MSIFKRKTKVDDKDKKQVVGKEEKKMQEAEVKEAKEIKEKKALKKTGIKGEKPKVPEQKAAGGLKTGFKTDTTVLIRPVITEKATEKQAHGCYIFEITRRANKFSVLQAIREIYRVDPVKVNIIRIKGKKVRYGRSNGRTKARKKAMVFLKKNDKIEFIKK